MRCASSPVSHSEHDLICEHLSLFSRDFVVFIPFVALLLHRSTLVQQLATGDVADVARCSIWGKWTEYTFLRRPRLGCRRRGRRGDIGQAEGVEGEKGGTRSAGGAKGKGGLARPSTKLRSTGARSQARMHSVPIVRPPPALFVLHAPLFFLSLFHQRLNTGRRACTRGSSNVHCECAATA